MTLTSSACREDDRRDAVVFVYERKALLTSSLFDKEVALLLDVQLNSLAPRSLRLMMAVVTLQT